MIGREQLSCSRTTEGQWPKMEQHSDLINREKSEEIAAAVENTNNQNR